ncbi:Aspartic peptidase domain superfamily [Arabidopsis suecica]|uniref:Aspartic peptidase domain superfamily n=1 Tax=Arabidopsis suecica TaxID=45249 RepID=A0A8T1XJV3_ARASU|nr:Aspartic peptidase domain superfamily [Arabidopsis suecica]
MRQGIMRLIIAAIFVMVCGYEATVLPLKRMIPPSHELDLTQLMTFDSARHGRLLQSPVHGSFNFPVERDTSILLSALYYTTVQIGTPPRELDVVIDTGSDLVWVSCNSCVGCPLQNVTFFDPGASSSAVKLAYSDKRCSSDLQKKSRCSLLESCTYKVEYGDGSVTSGYYISDLISFDTMSDWTYIASKDNSTWHPWVRQGAIIGTFPALCSTPCSTVSSQPLYYNPQFSHMMTVAMNDLRLPIDPSVFSVAKGYGTIIDSGTTLVHFPGEAYDPLIQAILNVVSQYGRPIPYESFQCFNITSGISSHLVIADMFPEVHLCFAGGASMVIKPEAYLFQKFLDLTNAIWCLGFYSSTSRRITIIGEVAIRDKMFVYDLDHQRIGWAEYNCSLDVTRAQQNKDIINTKHSTGNSRKTCSYLAIITYLLHFLF